MCIWDKDKLSINNNEICTDGYLKYDEENDQILAFANQLFNDSEGKKPSEYKGKQIIKFERRKQI